MRLGSLLVLVGRDLTRTRGALFTSGFGIAAGTAALVFFLALGLGVRSVLLGDVFPIDQVELEPPKGEDPGLAGLLFGGGDTPGVDEASVDALRQLPDVAVVYPKLRFAFPAGAFGGKEILGHDVGAHEIVGDGVDTETVRADLGEKPFRFEDPLPSATASCASDAQCDADHYCEIVSGESVGKCSEPVPVVVSQYLIEIFDKSIAPAHRLPPIGKTLVERAEGIPFTIRLGESTLGKAKRGEPRSAKARLVGVSRRAIDLGITLPIEVVRRWNSEYAGDEAATSYSSVVAKVRPRGDTARVITAAQAMKLEPHDTRARDVSVLLTGVTALLSLVAAVLLVVSASNIAYTFRVLVAERRTEIALYRAIGASRGDMRSWMLCLAVVVGLMGGAVGLAVARISALVADRLAASKLPDFPFKPATFFAFPLWLWAAGLGFAALFSLLGALVPAFRAARVDPALALAERA